MILTINRRIASFLLIGLGVGTMIKGEVRNVFTEVSPDNFIVSPSSEPKLQWSYTDCLDWAIAHNTDIRQTLLSILQADEDIAQAKDAWLPSVDFSTNQGYTNFPLSSAGRQSNSYTSSYGVNASWTIWEGSARKYRLISALAHWPVSISTSSVVLSFAVCTIIGVIFGFYPAAKASNLDPIEAIRYE